MANVIKHKRGSGSDPVASDLVVGEVAIRTDVGKLFTKMDNGSVAEIAGGGSDIIINTLSSSSGTGGGSATFNGSAYRFTLSQPPSVSAQQLLVSINGVIQKPVAGTGQPSEGFSVDGNDIILGDAPATGSDFFILTFKSLGVSEPADNSVTSAKIVDGAIVNADINASAAIAGTKISPNFGSQLIQTTGSVVAGGMQSTANLSLDSDVPTINFNDSNSENDFELKNNNGTFTLRDKDASSDRLTLTSAGQFTFATNVDFSSGIDVTGDLTVSNNLTVTNQSAFNAAVTINSGLFVGGTSVSGDEGGQIELTKAPNSTLTGSSIVFDQVVNSVRFFEGGGTNKGALLDLSNCAAGASSQILTSTTDATYTGNLIFGGGSTLNLSTNDIYLNARVINNQAGGTDDGLYLGYGNAGSSTNVTRVFGGGSTTHHFIYDATNFFPGTDSHSSLGTSTNTWLNLFADTVNVTGPGSTTLKLTTAAGAVDVVSLDTSHASSTKPQMHFKLQGTAAFIIDQNHNINMGGSLVPSNNGSGGRFFDIYNLGTDQLSYAITRLITKQVGSTNTTTGEILKFRNGDMSIRNNEPSSSSNINFFTGTSSGSHEVARFFSNKRFVCSRNTPADLGLTDPGVIFDRQSSRSGTNFDTFNGVGIMKDSNAWGTALYILRNEDGCGLGTFIEFAFRNNAGAQNTIGSITNNGASNVAFNPSSDYRLKEDVSTISNAITKIKLLTPRQFKWKLSPEIGYQDGFIAHEVQEIDHFKYLVTGEKDGMRKKYDDPDEMEPAYQGMDYSKLTPILVAALQEAVGKIETLETKVAALEAG